MPNSGQQYRHIKPRTPQTNGMVERFNGRIVSEVLAITVYSHDQLEQLLRGFNAAYNARRQRVLEGQTPDQVVAERLTAKPALAKAKPSGRAGPCDIIKARLIAESAKEVSQPDNRRVFGSHRQDERVRAGAKTRQNRCRSSRGAAREVGDFALQAGHQCRRTTRTQQPTKI